MSIHAVVDRRNWLSWPILFVKVDRKNGYAPRCKQLAVKADRLITAGKLDEARVQIVSACQCEPNNAELAERLQILYEVLALEPD